MSSGAAVPFWRAAGMTYISYSNICANLLRNCLKEPFKSEALAREKVHFSVANWSPSCNMHNECAAQYGYMSLGSKRFFLVVQLRANTLVMVEHPALFINLCVVAKWLISLRALDTLSNSFNVLQGKSVESVNRASMSRLGLGGSGYYIDVTELLVLDSVLVRRDFNGVVH
ncbi:ATP synthase subunit epsilon mitochondrial [Tripterygium wilfordii]|uniref:ATP synthase subunit epsilon, mitochondrial n=1 Tax=Tripterygium wilfordii TaxID=458696 RepID=A0A7J7CTC1_TRIWF|nr:ATP synthase subunit epsilon mitochondrial [Tripterygium wilfordii]